MKPYIDEVVDNYTIRTFDPNDTSLEEYVWHRDLNDRTIQIVAGEDWMLQFDNQLPHIININDNIFIPSMIYHRLIPGKTTLRIKIDEKF